MARATSTMSRTPNFSVAFQQVASVVAISKTRDPASVLDELIKQCFIILPNEPLGSAHSISRAIHVLFGIEVNTSEVKQALQRLSSVGCLVQLPGDQIGLSVAVKTELETRVKDARQLEADVRRSWLNQMRTRHPNLPSDDLWEVLQIYLALSFRRHGIQAVTVLDPEAEVTKEQTGSLSPMLNGAIRGKFSETDFCEARDAISSFFSTVTGDRQRAEYIAQLADGAFNYFSLTIAPEVAALLRSKLSPLTLFLDTNFLFGILHLDESSQVDVSNELLAAVQRFRLPFSLRYHQATAREMTNTLLYYRRELEGIPWSQSISRAAARSGRVKGVEISYHEANGSHAISVNDFFQPYDHWDAVVKERGIDIYNVGYSNQRLQARADLEAEYRDFLARANRGKPDDAIQHDMTVLDTVRSLRSEVKSSLSAGALLITCDIQLFRFELEASRRENRGVCVVLPSLLWQILRPFLSDGSNFDQAFAETFALPEFSLSRGTAIKATNRLLSILASYSNIPEEVAQRMLANDLLLNKLQVATDESERAALVESALFEETSALVEETAALKEQLSREKAEREERERKLELATNSLIDKERTLAEREAALHNKDAEMTELRQESQRANKQVEQIAAEIQRQKEERERTAAELQTLQQEKGVAEQRARRATQFMGIVLGILGVIAFEILVNVFLQWDWLLKHPNSYGLQTCISLMLFTGIVGGLVRPWRKFLLVTIGTGVFFVLLQILGGPPAQ